MSQHAQHGAPKKHKTVQDAWLNKRNINVVLTLHRKAFKLWTAEKHQCTTGRETLETLNQLHNLFWAEILTDWRLRSTVGSIFYSLRQMGEINRGGVIVVTVTTVIVFTAITSEHTMHLHQSLSVKYIS